MSEEKIDFIQKNENNGIFVAFLPLYIIIALSASHLIKLLSYKIIGTV